MKLINKLGQCIMIGFEGTTITKDLSDFIRESNIGGVILFKRNIVDPVQLSELCNQLQKQANDLPLIISIDHEGGEINRLPEPFTIIPESCLIGARNSSKVAYDIGEVMAKELKAVGINMNLFPLLDVNTNPSNPVIGKRAFSSNQLVVERLGLAIIAALQDNGVIACGKHFPGHGDTSEDSHKTLPVLEHDLERIKNVEIAPFQHAIDNGLYTIMSGHILYKRLDSKFPASLSKKIISTLLRREMGFDGVVITDDLFMDAISKNFSLEESAAMVLNSDSDIILLSKDIDRQKSIIESLMKKTESGAISADNIERSYQRILKLKKRFLMPYKAVNPKEVHKFIGIPKHKKIIDQIKKGS